MPGIAALIDSHKTANLDYEMRKILKTMMHEKDCPLDFFLDSQHGVALGCIGRPRESMEQPVYNHDESICLALNGEIFDSNNLDEEESRILEDNPSKLVIDLYEKYGSSFVRKLNGVFTVILWDRQNKTLLIANDRLGVGRLCHTSYGSKLFFASEAAAVLMDGSRQARIDEEAVADLFLFNHVKYERTLFRGINTLPPASLWEYKDGRLKKMTYWKFERALGRRRRHDERWYLEMCNGLFRTAIERQTRGHSRFVIGLSGGLDSRAILAVAHDQNLKAVCYSHGQRGSLDVELARTSADAVGMKYLSHGYDEKYLSDFLDHLRKCIRITGLAVELEDTAYSVFHHGEYLRDEFDVLIEGVLGTQLTRVPVVLSKWMPKLALLETQILQKLPFPAGVLSSGMDFFKMRGRAGNLRWVLSEEFFDLVRKLHKRVTRSMLKEAEGKGFFTVGEKLIYISVKNMTPYGFSPRFVVANHHIRCRSPYTDNDFLDFVLDTPVDLRSETNLAIQKFIVAENAPSLARIPYFSKAGGPFFIKENSDLSLLRRSFRPHHDLDDMFRTTLKPIVQQMLLMSKLQSEKFYNAENLRKIVDMHMTGQINAGKLIEHILGIELFHRLYIA